MHLSDDNQYENLAMIAPTLELSLLTKIIRRRELPLPGKVLVRQGQQVEARNIVAQTVIEPEHIFLDISRGLNVSPREASSHMERSDGELLNKGDLIAGPVGLSRRVVRAPKSGKINLLGKGQVLLEVDNKPYEMLAGLPGTVTALIPDLGAVIETTGAIVQGFWGNGKMDFGLMKLILYAPDDELITNQLDVSQRGTILIGGHCADAKVLEKAAEIPLRGLALTSMTSDLIPLAKSMPYPIMLLEGFGRRSLNTISYNILTGNDNRDIILDATPRQLSKGNRPEILIPLVGSGEMDAHVRAIKEFTPGQKVRISRDPFAAHIGTIDSICQDAIEFPSGLILPAANITLIKNGEQITVALANLEIIL